MRKGSSLPLLLIVIAFLIIPLAYWYFVYRDSQSNVKGAKISGNGNGVYVVINSTDGTWELNSYLCKDRESCLSSLTSGSKLETRGGDRVSNYEVVINYQNNWADYEYIKIYVKSGWGASNRLFEISDNRFIDGTIADQIIIDSNTYNLVLIPTKELVSGLFRGAEFSD